MKKVLLVCLLLAGMSLTTGCEPDSITEEYDQVQAADKEKAGSMGNTGGSDEEEDYN